jgi:carbamoylphosphate synthase large subunit
MRPYLLYNEKSYITGRALASHLGLRYHRNAENLMRRGHYPAIRYGNSDGIFVRDTNMNSAKVIKICADSLRFSKWAKEHDIFTPIYQKVPAIGKLPKFPFLVRTRWHRAGQDIRIIREKQDMYRLYRRLGPELFTSRYWVPFYETEYEIRVHYILGNVPRIFVKESTPEVNLYNPIRTSPNGWHYSIRNNLDEKYQKAQQLVCEVAEKLGLAFGGFDLAWSPKYKKYIIWEINTAPGLNSNTLEVYAEHLRPHV